MLRGARIAVVEDDGIMGGSLVQRLELEGADVLWLRQVARALGALRAPRTPIDAVICDIRLPDGTGRPVCRASQDQHAAALSVRHRTRRHRAGRTPDACRGCGLRQQTF